MTRRNQEWSVNGWATWISNIWNTINYHKYINKISDHWFIHCPLKMTDKFVITFIYLIFYGIRAHTNLTNTNFNDILTLFTPNDKTPIFLFIKSSTLNELLYWIVGEKLELGFGRMEQGPITPIIYGYWLGKLKVEHKVKGVEVKSLASFLFLVTDEELPLKLSSKKSDKSYGKLLELYLENSKISIYSGRCQQ